MSPVFVSRSPAFAPGMPRLLYGVASVALIGCPEAPGVGPITGTTPVGPSPSAVSRSTVP